MKPTGGKNSRHCRPLSNLRDNIKNLRFAVEEAEITLQQSKYEPPTTIRQAEINLDKAKRSLDQSVKGYALRVEQARSEMRTIKTPSRNRDRGWQSFRMSCQNL